MPLGIPLPPPLPLPPPPAAVATQLARAAVPSPHHHAIHRAGRRALGCCGCRSPSGGGAGRARGPEDAGGSSGRGEGLQRSASWRACRNHEPGTANSRSALLAAGLPGKSLLLGRRRRQRRRRLPGHGPARPEREGGRGGEAGSCPSFLPFFEIKIPSSGRSAGGGSGGLCCQPPRARRRTWASGALTPPGGTCPRRRPGLAPRGAHRLPPALGKRRRRRQSRGCGRCWRGRAESESGGRLH